MIGRLLALAALAPAPALADEVDAVEPVPEVIVVTGTRSERPLDAAPVVTEVIDRERIEQSGAETVADALAQRPGLWLARGVGGTGVTIQGLGPEYVLVLVDGRRQLGRVDGAIDLDRLAVGGIERIEVVRGPGSAMYGADALGGVVQIVRRRPDGGARGAATARLDGRLASDLRGEVTAAGDAWSADADAGWRRGAAYRRDPARPATTIPAYDDVHGAGRLGWRDARASIEVGGDYLQRDLRGVDAAASGAVLDRRNLIEIGGVHAGARWTGDATRVTARAGAGLYRDQYVVDQRGASAQDRREETRERLVETGAQVEHARGRHRAAAGAELLREALDADRLAIPGARWRAAVFAQDEWHLGADYRWLVVPAARLDHDSQFGTHATPRLAARWDATDRLVARASAGTGFRAPGFKELLLRFENPGAGYVVEGNPMLRPERSISLQLGVEGRAGALWAAANAFDNELVDLIAPVTLDDGGAGPLRFGYDNLGRARTAGVEVNAAATAGRLALELGWAFTHARDRDLGRALEGVPAHRVAAAVRWRDPGEAFDAIAEATVTGPRPYYLSDDPAEAAWTEPRVDVRARLARRFGDRLRGFLGVENLLDAGDDRFDPIAPRTLYVGLEAAFATGGDR